MRYQVSEILLSYSIFLKSDTFAGEALFLGKISFLILSSLVGTSDLFSHLP